MLSAIIANALPGIRTAMPNYDHPMHQVLVNFQICAVLIGKADEEIAKAEELLGDMQGTPNDPRLDAADYERLAAISMTLYALLHDLTEASELCRAKAGVL